jgi:hypothetical protein
VVCERKVLRAHTRISAIQVSLIIIIILYTKLLIFKKIISKKSAVECQLKILIRVKCALMFPVSVSSINFNINDN